MNKQDKEQAVLEIKEKLDKATSIYLTDFTGLTVAETNELRDEFFNAKVDYKVLKNTLIKKALEQGEKPKVKLALVERQVYESKKLNELASLPSKPEIISSVISSLHAPISGIV